MNSLKEINAREIFKRNLFYINISLDELTFILNDLNELVNFKREQLENKLLDNIDEEKRDQIENTLYYYQNQPTIFLIEASFLSLIILLENEIDNYCKDFRKYKELSIDYNDFKGDLLEKFKIFSSKLLKSDFNFQKTLWQDIIGLYEIRNLLVHKRGCVSDFGKRKTVEGFIARNKSFEISNDEIIYISHQACLDSIKIVETFFVEITDFALRIFPEKQRSVDNEKAPF